ncbi:type VI secretion system-associated FHA domain protein TagH [Labrenzia sp. PHM005]|uniref:type VI secretion system-associated FHA domain protein TagH n=1 Tax=Labrenzia sp. PHM005 TaxID=2590016 RepID=UPI0011408A1D|nr:type VI secretion system-associated FHA domain protein TagH [Labrenzia sp. PHM005]QDG77465.1 type VI secretion system-associated FHA domain protein TagH [Labrenzia sp. PHM005]
MQITLRIENVDRLETGGQVSYTCSDRGFDIGRHEHLDWSLPDPHRVISGKHCEVRFEGNGFVLYDMSTNGTFMNGSPNRMDKPHGLKSGDRFMIGDYIISVDLEGVDAVQAAPDPVGAPAGNQWASPFESAPEPAIPHSAGWPAAAPAAQDPSYPIPEAHNPWGSPQTGMEGRHAPPSDAPGIGTPVDDVWSQQGHGWGNADPALYSPQPETPIQQPPRPAQADPMDHLAPQPDLQPSPDVPPSAPQPFAPSSPAPQEAPPASPFASEDRSAELAAPLFGMPDLGPEEPAPLHAAPPVPEAQVESSPSFTDAAPEPVFPEPAAPPAPPAQTGASDPFEEVIKAAEVSSSPETSAPAEPVVQPVEIVAGSEPGEAEPAEQTAAQSHPAAVEPDTTAIDFLKAFAEGAGIPQSALEGREPEELARELGEILTGITGDLMGLLAARSQVKAMTRNANRTMISRSGNNALKFSPTPQAALQTMLSKSAEENGYLPIRKAMSSAFKDIQKHHVWTYSAMQKAAARFEETLSPKAIESEGLVQKSTFGNLKAKQWDRLEERWTSLVSAHDDGLVGVFTQYFTENYEELSRADEGDAPGF